MQLDVGNEPYLSKQQYLYLFAYELFSPILVKYFGQVQTDYRQKVTHMSPPCKLHRWAKNQVEQARSYLIGRVYLQKLTMVPHLGTAILFIKNIIIQGVFIHNERTSGQAWFLSHQKDKVICQILKMTHLRDLNNSYRSIESWKCKN